MNSDRMARLFFRATLFGLFYYFFVSQAQGESSFPQFDAPSLIAAEVKDEAVELRFRLTSVAAGPETLAVHRWVVRVKPRTVHFGPDAKPPTIVDYGPKTSTEATVDGPLVVKTTREQSQSAGLSIDGNYASLVKGHAGVDRGSSELQTVESRPLAAIQANIASGTFDRGSGAMFKLDATPQTVLEGEKEFWLRMTVPPGWRGGILDVELLASARQTKRHWFSKNESKTRREHFSIPVFLSSDRVAAELAQKASNAEQRMRFLHFRSASPKNEPYSWKRWLEKVSSPSLGFASNPLENDENSSQHARPGRGGNQEKPAWIANVLLGEDPLASSDLPKLPVAYRVAALDYFDAVRKLSKPMRLSEASKVTTKKSTNPTKIHPRAVSAVIHYNSGLDPASSPKTTPLSLHSPRL